MQAYHPFDLYFKHLPTWDGTDRVTELAKRVSDTELWTRAFHRWMLGNTAQWMNCGAENQRPNSVAPILISTKQGLGKSTFCRMLLPKPLQDYFTESFDLANASGAENKLASYGLINLDEFDRLPATRMPQLKNLMQMEAVDLIAQLLIPVADREQIRQRPVVARVSEIEVESDARTTVETPAQKFDPLPALVRRATEIPGVDTLSGDDMKILDADADPGSKQPSDRGFCRFEQRVAGGLEIRDCDPGNMPCYV